GRPKASCPICGLAGVSCRTVASARIPWRTRNSRRSIRLQRIDARGGRLAHLIGFGRGKNTALPVFKSGRVHRRNVQIFERVRTNADIYTRIQCNTLSSIDVQADFMYATCFSKPVQIENRELFYQGVLERWQVLPG
ncbi:unnamed protein product, partial [Ascophyllum nodosum]